MRARFVAFCLLLFTGAALSAFGLDVPSALASALAALVLLGRG